MILNMTSNLLFADKQYVTKADLNEGYGHKGRTFEGKGFGVPKKSAKPFCTGYLVTNLNNRDY